MEVEKPNAAVKPTPLLLQAVSKVDQVVARLQELQSSIAGSQLVTQSRFTSPSGRIPDLLGRSPNKTSAMESRVSGEFQGSFLKLGRKKGSTSAPEQRKSLTLADGWRHWSSPAKDVHDVLSEILLANQLNKRFVNLVGSSTSHQTAKKSTKLLPDSKPDTENASVNSSMSSGIQEPTVCSSVESLASTPLRVGRPVPLNRRSSSKKKPPPHLFKVVVGNDGPAAKATVTRKITTPSPLYKRRSERPVRVSGELRSSGGSSIRCSVERKRLTNSASLRRSTEKFVEACRAMMEEDEQLKRGKAVHFSNSPPVVIRPLVFESPGKKKKKSWLIHRFPKPKEIKLKKASSRDLPTLISRLPQKVEPSSVPVISEPVKVRQSLPLPPARHAENVLKNSSRGMALKASKDKKSGYVSYELEPTVLLNSSRESLAEVDGNSLKDKKRCSVGCPSKDAPSSGRKSENIAMLTDANLPNYMKPRAGSGAGKENSSKSIDVPAKPSSGTSLLHRAKDWVSLHKTKDKSVKKLPESSERVAVNLGIRAGSHMSPKSTNHWVKQVTPAVSDFRDT